MASTLVRLSGVYRAYAERWDAEPEPPAYEEREARESWYRRRWEIREAELKYEAEQAEREKAKLKEARARDRQRRQAARESQQAAEAA